jgi:hypothetical protein
VPSVAAAADNGLALLCNIGQAPGIGLTPDSQAPVGGLILTDCQAQPLT